MLRAKEQEVEEHLEKIRRLQAELVDEATAKAKAKGELHRARAETHAAFRERKVPRIRGEAIRNFEERDLPTLLNLAREQVAGEHFAIGQVEYRSLVLHYFSDTREKIRDVDRYFPNSFLYAMPKEAKYSQS